MLYTLGHSTLKQAEFARAARKMDVVIDIRSHPTSSHSPHFKRESMEQWLPAFGLAYEWWPELGGWDVRHAQNDLLRKRMAKVGVDLTKYAGGYFPKGHIAAQAPEREGKPVWTSRGLLDFAYYTMLDEFQHGALRLVGRFGGEVNACIVCCESCWYKCHRSMVADFLVAQGVFVGHLPCKPPVRATSKKFQAHAGALGNRLSRYPDAVRETWPVCSKTQTL